MKNILFYHKGCADGMGAAWCFWDVYEDDLDYIPHNYGEPIPNIDFKDKTIYLVDYSFSSDVLINIANKCKKIIILDHHQTFFENIYIIKDIENIDYSHSTMHKSGAGIAWGYTHPNQNMPTVLAAIQDRDLWEFNLEYTEPIMAAVYSYPMNFDIYDQLMNLNSEDLEVLIREGQAIIRTREKEISRLIKNGRSIQLGNKEVFAVNAPHSYASDIGSTLSKEHDIVAIYIDQPEYRVFSLRSKKGSEVDVSAIAKLYGGGGHKHAAGFRVPRFHQLAMV